MLPDRQPVGQADAKGVNMLVRAGTAQHDAVAEKTIFRFEVWLIDGPITPSFAAKHPAPSRTIDVRGSNTLDDLHLAIFRAFDRYDTHMYEFQIGGKKPMDRKAVRYGTAEDDYSGEKSAEATTIAALNLKIEKPFFYWFDFGDDWWHELRLLAVNPPAKGKGRYPRIVEKKGESPPQYADWEAEEDADGYDAADALATRTVQQVEDAAAAVARQRWDEISGMMENFCKSRLTEGYVAVCEALLEATYRVCLPMERGKTQTWAAGMVHAAGMINFLQDPAFEPHMKLRDIAPHFGVSSATMENKSREIRDAVDALPLDPRFCLPERLADNPMVWMKPINGIIIDFRRQPREAQEAALKAGLIPFIPEAGAAAPQKQQVTARKKKDASGKDEKKPVQYNLFK
jgi:hypothetical protein